MSETSRDRAVYLEHVKRQTLALERLVTARASGRPDLDKSIDALRVFELEARQRNDQETGDRLRELGDELVAVGHAYQREEERLRERAALGVFLNAINLSTVKTAEAITELRKSFEFSTVQSTAAAALPVAVMKALEKTAIDNGGVHQGAGLNELAGAVLEELTTIVGLMAMNREMEKRGGGES